MVRRAVAQSVMGCSINVKVRGRWMYLYRAIDNVGDTVEFWFSERRRVPSRFVLELISTRSPA